MRLIVLIVFIFFTACEKPTYDTAEIVVIEEDKAQQVVDEAIDTAGGLNFDNSKITFDFREHHYERVRAEGEFSYHRVKLDSLGETRDILDNTGFRRLINNEEVEVIDTMAAKYARSVNSVIYFALLPYRLNDPAVNKEYIGEKEINGIIYDKIRVTFDSEGGGEDFDDVFIYWINQNDKTVDFLAYEYHTDGGGIRFREARNPRTIGGIRFVDYINYEPKVELDSLAEIDSLYINNGLVKLSEINLENPSVELIKEIN